MKLDFETDAGLGFRATLGVILLRTDETLENEVHRYLSGDGVAVHYTRVQSSPEVNAQTLGAMRADLPRAASMLPPSAPFDVIGYGCTSGATVIGADGVTAAVREVFPDVAVTNPMSAAKAAFQALGIRRLALLSPYIEPVSRALRQTFEDDGTEIVAFAGFEEEQESVVARMTPASLLAAIERVVAETGADNLDGVFMSCTNLRMAPVIAEAEARTGLPVLSSNQCLLWHMSRLAGLTDPIPGAGRLFQIDARAAAA